MILSILVLALPVSLASASSEGPIEDGSILQRYDLRSVLPSFDAAPSWSQTMHEGFDDLWNDSMPTVELESFYEGAAPESISELITLILGDELHHEGRVVSLDGNSSLLVLAPPAVQKKIGLVLGAFEKALSAHTLIQVDVLDLEEGELDKLIPSNEIPLAEAEGFIESLRSRAARHRSHLLNLSPGRTAILRQQKAHALVVDYDVEIAERAMAFDPRGLTLREGLQLFARGVPSANGTHLSLLYSDAELVGGVTEMEAKLVGNLDHDRDTATTYVDGPNAIQSGQLRTRSVACTTFLSNSSALVFGSSMTREGQRSMQVVVMRKTGGIATPFRRVDIPDSTRSLLMVNTELLGIPDFEFEATVFDPSEESFAPRLHARLNTKPTSFLSDWLKYRFSVWRQLGPWAIIITDPAWDDAAAGELDKLIASIRPTVDVLSARVELRAHGVAEGAFGWSLASLPGFECGVVLNHGSTALVDYDVEVAHGASVYDSEVIATYQGLMASFGVSNQGQALLLGARGSGTWPAPGTESFTPGGILSSPLRQHAFSAIGFDERRTGSADQAFRFGATGPGSGSDAELQVSFEIRR